MFYFYLFMPLIVMPMLYAFPSHSAIITLFQKTMAQIVRGFPNYWDGLYYNIVVYYDPKELFVTFLVLATVIYLFVKWKKNHFKFNAIYSIYAVFLLWLLIGCLYTADRYSGIKTCKGVFLIIVVGLYFSNCSKKKLDTIAFGVVIIGLIESVIGILQFFGLYYVLFPYLLVPNQGSNGYIFGTIGHVNQFGNFMVMSIFVVLIKFFLARTKKLRWFYFIVVSMMLFNIILTSCRSCWLAFIITAGMFLLCHYKTLKKSKQSKYIVIFIVVIILEFLSLKGFAAIMPNNPLIHNLDRKTSSSEISNSHGRILLWKKTLVFISNAPVIGNGTGSFWATERSYRQQWINDINANPSQYTKKDVQSILDFTSVKEHSHNEYLQQYAENGLIGFLLLVAICIMIVASYILLNRRKKSLENGLFFFGAFSTGVIALFDFPFHMIHTITWFAMLLGCYIAALNKETLFQFKLRRK